MHFNIYIDDGTGDRLTQAAQAAGETRNAVIRRAVREWLDRQGKAEWPAVVLAHGGDPAMPPFETSREQLGDAPADPLA